jgi:excinuclease ABC subunit B
LYADRVTNSMRVAIDETDRRREKQVEYNAAHGIVPKSVSTPVLDVMEGARADVADMKSSRGKGRKVAEAAADYATLGPAQLSALLRRLEQQMYKHAQDLEFEDAARLRDEIQRVKSRQLVS